MSTLIRITIFSFFTFLAIGGIQPLFSHGTVISPPSRTYICRGFSSFPENPENPISQGCIDARAALPTPGQGSQQWYDWDGVLQGNANDNHTAVVPNGQLASGGNPAKFGGLDLVGSAWLKTPVSAGPYTVTWRNKAPHVSEYYRVYITSADWTPDQPLSWDKLELLAETPFSLAEDTTHIPVVLPARTGHHVIYSVWQRPIDLSGEAFYSTSDVDFGSDPVDPDDPDDPGSVGTKVSVNQDFEVGQNLTVTSDVYFPSLAGASTLNLTIDANGKVGTSDSPLLSPSPKTESDQVVLALNKFNFSIREKYEGYSILQEGLYLKQGASISGIEAIISSHTGTGNQTFSNSSVRIFRLDKLKEKAEAELIFELKGKIGKENLLQKQVAKDMLVTSHLGIDNEKFIYYAEVYLCEECEFVELKFLGQD